MPTPIADVRAALADIILAATRSTRPVAGRALVQGERFHMHRDACRDEDEATRVWEVLRVTECSAVVRALAKRRVEIKDLAGKVKAAWDAPSDAVTISIESSVRRIECE
jgi:hypothetical protein